MYAYESVENSMISKVSLIPSKGSGHDEEVLALHVSACFLSGNFQILQVISVSCRHPQELIRAATPVL
jgi:hypothetical protein